MNKDSKYENYLTQLNPLPFEEAMEIYERILQNSLEDDEEFEEFWELGSEANDSLCGSQGKLVRSGKASGIMTEGRESMTMSYTRSIC